MRKTITILSVLTLLLTPVALAEETDTFLNWDWLDDIELFVVDEPVAEAEVVEEVVEVEVVEEVVEIEAVEVVVETTPTEDLTEKVDRAQFTTQVIDREPVDDISELYTDFGDSVLFFTDIRECVDCVLEHQWMQAGEEVARLDAEVRYPRFRWWSQKNHLTPGKWTVNTLLNGEVVATRNLEYVEATQVQIQQAPVQYHVRKRATIECEEDLVYWRELLANDPNEDYYKFKIDQIEKRCSVR
jgi:autonomous glycyl radical cofactor GrcA